MSVIGASCSLPRLQNHSMGTISQAETVIVSSQQPRQGIPPATSNSRIRTASFEMRGTDPTTGIDNLVRCHSRIVILQINQIF